MDAETKDVSAKRNLLSAIEWAGMSEHHTHCALAKGESLNCNCSVGAANRALPIATSLLAAMQRLTDALVKHYGSTLAMPDDIRLATNAGCDALAKATQEAN